jgi:uncharacterized membrane protein YccC
MSKWFWNLSFMWQNILGFGLATIAGVGIAWAVTRVIPTEYQDIASLVLLLGAVGCVAIGMHLDSKEDNKK